MSLAPLIEGRPLPEGRVDRDYTPAPRWVEELLAEVHRTKVSDHAVHIAVWERLVRRLPVTHQAKALAAVLGEHWPKIRPSIERLAGLSGLSRGSVTNALWLLEQTGLLRREQQRGSTTTYVPLYPMRAITAEEVASLKRVRRREPHPQPGHHVATPTGEDCDEGDHHVARGVATSWSGGGHDVAGGWPPRGRKDLNEDLNEDLKPRPRAREDVA